jgi:hypothetical protein
MCAPPCVRPHVCAPMCVHRIVGVSTGANTWVCPYSFFDNQSSHPFPWENGPKVSGNQTGAPMAFGNLRDLDLCQFEGVVRTTRDSPG